MAQDPELVRRLLRARDRMDAASHEDWPVARLARVSGVSQAHFARSFKVAFGLPPHRYLLTRRIARACVLLRDTDLPILEIALGTGWRSLGSFGRTFRSLRFVRCGVGLAYGRAGLRIGAVAGHPRVGRRRVTGGVKCDHRSAPPLGEGSISTPTHRDNW